MNLRALRPKRSEIGRTPLLPYIVTRTGFEPILTPSKGVVLPIHHQAMFERIVGIEPTSPTWKEGVITIIRYSHIKELIEGGENYDIST